MIQNPEPNNANHILLLEISAEGGSLRLVLERTELGIFSYRAIENSFENLMFDDEDFHIHKPDIYQITSPLVIDWNGALNILDNHRWPWPMLFPVFIHPCIQTHLLSALKDRYSQYPDISFNDWENDFPNS